MTVMPDAPRDGASVAADATFDAPKSACWEQDPPGQRFQVVRVRVQAGGNVSVRRGTRTYSVDYADMDIAGVISGNMTRVLPGFRRHFYVARAGGFTDTNGSEGLGDPNHEIAELIAAKGEERIVVVALPPQGSEDDIIPTAIRNKYGAHTAMVFRVCPVR